MQQFISWFTNPFDNPRISHNRLNLFSTDVIARITNGNGNGMFTALLVQLTNAYQDHFGDIKDVDLASAVLKSLTAAKDNVMATFKAMVQQQEGAVRSEFGRDSPTYLEFFPLGLTEYTNASLGNVETLMTRMVDRAQTYQADLGTDFVDMFTDVKTNFRAARSAQLTRKSTVSDERTSRHSTRAALNRELFRAMFTVGMNFPGDVDRCMDFFDQRILRP